jgi:hypothetical protein
VVDGSSLLGVLDWDEAALDAPEREFGLFLLDGGDRVLERVLNSYERAGGANDLDAERIEHAALERHLVDLAVRFERVLGRDPTRVQAALADVVSWGMERTLRLERYRQAKTSGIGPESSSGRETSSQVTTPGVRSAPDGEEIPFDSHGQKWMDHCQANSPSQCLRTNSAAILN